MSGKIVDKFQLKDGRKIVFRYPQVKDIKAMADYINTLSKEQTFLTFQGEQISVAYETEFVNKLLKKIADKNAVQILVYCKSQLVGISDVVMGERAIKHVGNFGITIAKEFRGQGIGKYIMQLTLAEAFKNLPQLKIIMLGCFADNIVALNLYKKMGFKEYGKLPKGLMHKGHFDDHIYMYKKVRD